MKRNENLIPLSRDHHFGLLCCWKIRQGISKNVPYERIRNYINYFWQESLKEHFKTEDTVLPEVENESLNNQMENEHREISKLIKSINQYDNMNLLADFADALQKHIRFEERMLFPHLEEYLSDKQMNEIGVLLNGIHRNEQDNYPYEFWK